MQAAGPKPGNQWNINGGFCGAWSTQQGALSVGAWISQDFVRKANGDQTGIDHNMHGDTKLGYEVMPSNVAYTANALKLDAVEWDYMQPAPQASKFKVGKIAFRSLKLNSHKHLNPVPTHHQAWLKSHLVKGRAIVWFPLCKGDPHSAYPGSVPNGGQCDHVEPMLGIWSNHPLDDATVYDDDVILHFSDQDTEPYYRPMSRYCTHTVLILYSYCTHCAHTVLTVLILYSCCTHTVLILYSYCTHTVLTVLILY
jgi:hypothetical protein